MFYKEQDKGRLFCFEKSRCANNKVFIFPYILKYTPLFHISSGEKLFPYGYFPLNRNRNSSIFKSVHFLAESVDIQII